MIELDPQDEEYLTRYIVILAKKYSHRDKKNRQLFNDYCQEGWVGLMEALRDHDPSRGACFRTYAVGKIRTAIRTSFTRSARGVRVPYDTYRLVMKLERGEADESSLSANMREAVRLAGIALYFPKHSESSGDPDMLRNIVDTLARDDDETEDISRRIYGLLDRLDDRRRKVVVWRLGLDGQPIKTFKEIGECLGVSKSRAEGMLDEAIIEMKTYCGDPRVACDSPAVKVMGDPKRRYIGVYHVPSRDERPYRVMIYINKRLKTVGYYATDRDAAVAYDEVARMHGRPVNFPVEGEEPAVVGRCGGRTRSRRKREAAGLNVGGSTGIKEEGGGRHRR
jgi:RNA polymerase sigma factor FliA